MVMAVFEGNLYAGLSNMETGAELWQTSNGTTWTQVNVDGFNDTNNRRVITLAEFDGQLYAGTQNYNPSLGVSFGAQVWRSPDGMTWEKVVDAGFGDADNWGVGGLVVYRVRFTPSPTSYHYADPTETKGMEVWRSYDRQSE